MYKGDSDQLADYMVIWGVKSTDECVNVRSTHPTFELTSLQETIYISQDQTKHLNISANIHVHDMKGIV